MSSAQQSLQKTQNGCRSGVSEEKYFMNANECATKIRIRCYSREATLGTSWKARRNQTAFTAESTAESHANEIK